MKLNVNVMTKIWKESISALVIITAILIIGGHTRTVPETVMAMSETVVSESGELPSQVSPVEETPVEEVSIDQLVADVESGKAGNGDARKEYLGKYYDEVQTIINKKYELKPVISSRGNYQRSTSGNKAEYQSYAYELVITMGWSESDFQSLINLWERESGWNPNSHNNSSGAHGIPQSLPASKMSSHGEDYYTNANTQIRWGLDYIANRYGSPTSAWNHFQSKGWY